MRRVFNDAMVSAAALGALLALLVAVDSRVRDQVMMQLKGGRAHGDIAVVEGQLRAFMSIVVDAVRDAMMLHTTLTVFVVVATVLTVFMLRT